MVPDCRRIQFGWINIRPPHGFHLRLVHTNQDHDFGTRTTLRASKRQAAPFSRRHPKAPPQKPERKSGQKYGRRCRRRAPKQVDEVVEVPLPSRCPRFGGDLEEEETVSQFQAPEVSAWLPTLALGSPLFSRFWRARRSHNLASWKRREGIVERSGTRFARDEGYDILSKPSASSLHQIQHIHELGTRGFVAEVVETVRGQTVVTEVYESFVSNDLTSE